MGTNFYLITRNKNMAQQYAPYSYKLVDEPYFGYEIHIAKTSCGWLPLFQSHKEGINSVREYKTAYESGEFEIFDEYGDVYTWEEFDERVLKFNGGIRGVESRKKIDVDTTSQSEYIPISHFDYKYNYYCVNDYFSDEDGYEFDRREFS